MEQSLLCVLVFYIVLGDINNSMIQNTELRTITWIEHRPLCDRLPTTLLSTTQHNTTQHNTKQLRT